MALDKTKLMPLSSLANSDAPRHWTYTTPDAKATVVGSGYFDDAAADMGLQQGDIIWSVDANGGTETLTTVFIDAISGAGVVTVLSTVQILA